MNGRPTCKTGRVSGHGAVGRIVCRPRGCEAGSSCESNFYALGPTLPQPLPGREGGSSVAHRRRGTVLIVTMFVTIVLAAMVVVFARQARVHALASANRAAQTKASFIAHGALQYVIAQLAAKPGRPLCDDELPAEALELGGGYFWFVRGERDRSEGLTFGIIDEAGKLNMNQATRDTLVKLPRMTEELASSVVDWRDSDTEPQPAGAESPYYLSLDDGYYAKDRPFETLDELLLVRGAEYDLVFGEDSNQNHELDPNENDGEATLPVDNGDSVLDRGLMDYLTVYTIEPNNDAQGEPRVNVNAPNPRGMLDLLERTVGKDQVEVTHARIMVNRPFRNLMDLYFRVGLTEAQLDALADHVTTSSQPVLPGLVNVNTAPLEVLAALPGMTQDDAAALLEARASTDADEGGLGWVAQALPRPKAVIIGDHITHRSFQFTVDVVAVSPRGRSFKRYRAVIDAAGELPRIVHFEDITALGWPLGSDLLQQIRRGTFTGGTTPPAITETL